VSQGDPRGPCSAEQQKDEDDVLNAFREVVHLRLHQQTLVLDGNGVSVSLALPSQADICVNKYNSYAIISMIQSCTAVIQSGSSSGPGLALLYFSRGFAYQGKRDYDHAIADFDQAIRLEPNNEPAFLNRGEAYLGKRDYDRAIADYDQAIRLAPNNTADLNARCRARAILNRDLPKALADCDESLRLRADNPRALDSRGLTDLRLARFDDAIADYAAALRLNPKSASSLYGRALAKRANGDIAGSTADHASARANQKNIADVFAGYGMQAVPPLVGGVFLFYHSSRPRDS